MEFKRFERRLTASTRLFWVAAPASHLALFRIVVFGVLLGAAETQAALRWSTLPPALLHAPIGLRWLTLPLLDPLAARLAWGLMIGAASFALVGLWTRLSAALAASTAVYVLGIAQFSGAVFHNHHLVWFAALLAASPCGDALSLDALLRRRRKEPPPEPAVAYGLPLRISWLIIALIFFFPGLWKLRASGLAWAFSDNLRNLMYQKWFEFGVVPALRFDHWPHLLRWSALAALIFELSFGFLVFGRSTRRVAVGLALLFHLMTQVLTGIAFSALWPCYVVFFLADEQQPAPVTENRWGLAPILAVAGGLMLGVGGFGALGIENGWPFACYPTFRTIAAPEIPWMAIEVEDDTGHFSEVAREDLHGPSGQREWATMWQALKGRKNRTQRLAAYWQHITADRPDLRTARRVRFYSSLVSVIPEDRGRIRQRELLAELPGSG